MSASSYTVYYLSTNNSFSGSTFIEFFGFIITSNKNAILISRIIFALFIIFYISTWIAVFFASAITKEIQKQSEEIEYRTLYDLVTGLANRKFFLDKLTQEIQSADIKNYSFTVLLIDINHFTEINDTLGHKTGDKILKEFGERLKICAANIAIPARISADEFSVIILSDNKNQEVIQFSDALSIEMEKPFKINDQEIIIDFHIGTATYPNDGKDPETLIKNTEVVLTKTIIIHVN